MQSLARAERDHHRFVYGSGRRAAFANVSCSLHPSSFSNSETRMTTRTAALLAGLLLLPAAARAEPVPACPLIMTGADFWYWGRPACRLGQFTFRDFLFDNDDGLATAFVYPIELGLFKDHLDITMH